MFGLSNSKGYTIVEVMIFLAISGVMFIMAASFINGKQSSAEFRQAVNDLNAQIQRVINDVENGYYPSAGNFTCTSDGSGNPPSFSTSATAQGLNIGCVFLGKVMQFGVNNTDGRGYNIYSVAGRQYVTTATLAKLPSNFTESKAVPIIDTVNDPKVFDSTDRKTIFGGAKITKVRSGSNPINGIGFYSNFSNYDGSEALVSGSRSVIVVSIPGTSTSLNETEVQMITNIKNQTVDTNILSNPDFSICLEGGRGSYGLVKIGGTSGQRLTSKVYVSKSPIGSC